jgi:hypothetical protein
MIGGMRIALTALLVPVVSYVMWSLIANPLSRWIASRIPEGRIKHILTKHRGGDY